MFGSVQEGHETEVQYSCNSQDYDCRILFYLMVIIIIIIMVMVMVIVVAMVTVWL